LFVNYRGGALVNVGSLEFFFRLPIFHHASSVDKRDESNSVRDQNFPSNIHRFVHVLSIWGGRIVVVIDHITLKSSSMMYPVQVKGFGV
jgi:hypothetical protein